MSENDLLKAPILTLSKWKATLFPSLADEESDTDMVPADIAIKWATKAVQSLPNKPIKPTQRE